MTMGAFIFQSTLPAGEATNSSFLQKLTFQFQSTLPAGEATPSCLPRKQRLQNFNPRFPRGKRLCRSPAPLPSYYISIHASRGGSDRAGGSFPCSISFYFNPRFPRGKRPSSRRSAPRHPAISIHASRGGSDLFFLLFGQRLTTFQSTLPAGEATS